MKTDIPTFSGNYFSFTDVVSNVVSIEDIAHGLSNVCRFAGQCPQFYSVAQHSVMVAYILEELYGIHDPEVLLQGLFHDASEAFLGDMTTPLKKLIPEYMVIEARVQADLMRRFGLPSSLHRIVSLADLSALRMEKEQLLKNHDVWAVLEGVECLQEFFVFFYTPEQAKAQFLNTFYRLMSARRC